MHLSTFNTLSGFKLLKNYTLMLKNYWHKAENQIARFYSFQVLFYPIKRASYACVTSRVWDEILNKMKLKTGKSKDIEWRELRLFRIAIYMAHPATILLHAVYWLARLQGFTATKLFVRIIFKTMLQLSTFSCCV